MLGACLIHGSDFLLTGEIIIIQIAAHIYPALTAYWAVFKTLHSITLTRNSEALLFHFTDKEIKS